jgi:hypothetical protein
MSYQPPQRRFLRWAGVLVVLVVLVVLIALPLALRAGYYYKEDVEAECAVHFEADKPDLAGHHWSWWWLPGWVCEFERDGRRWERHLW